MHLTDDKIKKALPNIEKTLCALEVTFGSFENNWRSWNEACTQIRYALGCPELIDPFVIPTKVSRAQYNEYLRNSVKPDQLTNQRRIQLCNFSNNIYMLVKIRNFVIRESIWETEELKDLIPPLEIYIHQGIVKSYSLCLLLEVEIDNARKNGFSSEEHEIYKKANNLLEILHIVENDGSLALCKENSNIVANHLVHIMESNREVFFNVD